MEALQKHFKAAITLDSKDICTIASLAVDDTLNGIVWRTQWQKETGWLALSTNVKKGEVLVEVHHNLDVQVSGGKATGLWFKDDVQNQVKIFKYFFDKGLIEI